VSGPRWCPQPDRLARRELSIDEQTLSDAVAHCDSLLTRHCDRSPAISAFRQTWQSSRERAPYFPVIAGEVGALESTHLAIGIVRFSTKGQWSETAIIAGHHTGFNSAIFEKLDDVAYWNRSIKYRRIEPGVESLLCLVNLAVGYFSHVLLCIGESSVVCSANQPVAEAVALHSPAIFELNPSVLVASSEAIVAELRKEPEEIQRAYILDRNENGIAQFVSFDRVFGLSGRLVTRHPYLLVRYNVRDGRPRYHVFDVASGMFSPIFKAYHNGRNASRLISTFQTAIERYGPLSRC